MKKKLAFIVCCVLFLKLAIGLASPKQSYVWYNVAEGVSYTKFTFDTKADGTAKLHAFLIDPAKVKFDIVKGSKDKLQLSVKQFAQKNKASIVVNGGFFTEDLKSIGLLIKDSNVINFLHKTSWWSIFGIKKNKPFIILPKQYKKDKDISMALQAGPRLIVNGEIPKLKNSLAKRSAIGFKDNNKVIIAVTEGSPITITEMAERMKNSRYKKGLECINAMALDGGSSSQIYAHINDFELSVPNISSVSNAIAIYLK